MTLEQYFQDLVEDETALKHSRLVEVSALDEDELEQFRHWWPSIPVEHRRRLMARLVALSEEDVELDFDAVFRHCLRDDDPEVREKAVSGLWESDDRTLIGTLVDLLQGDPAEQVRASVAISLGKFSTLSQLGKLLPQDGGRIKELLTDIVQNEEESLDVRRRALEAVAAFNTDKVRELIEWAYSNEEPRLRISAVYAMGRTCDLSWLSTILNELGSEDAAMRYEAANACAELGEEEEVPYLIRLLQDDDLQVQLSVIRTLGAIGGRLAKRALQRCLGESDEAVREAAEEALNQLEGEEGPLYFGFRSGSGWEGSSVVRGPLSHKPDSEEGFR